MLEPLELVSGAHSYAKSDESLVAGEDPGDGVFWVLIMYPPSSFMLPRYGGLSGVVVPLDLFDIAGSESFFFPFPPHIGEGKKKSYTIKRIKLSGVLYTI